ncbi:Endonuclease/exonuclease/phosphatase [Brachyspira pilosicoli WesB]|uniref:Endonuclease/exonuclease/phosphatase n=1 Tax=Brachyspira pilosicoli WesB TaxID=1161918 RepID=K0JGA4_BRAPL|nr:hypothetical protein [Brachyspira pilosicoli]CCG55777.1 Endonuclease/exonuclease/phosphatase [Brachyspira pilosicoli WesB]
MKLLKIFFISLIIASTVLAQANTTVYIGKTGKKYHRENCRTLRGNKYPISIQEAKERGYTACKVCKPPMN